MNRLKMAIPALAAALALGASICPAALGNLEVLFSAGKTSEQYKGESGAGTLATLAGSTIVCTSATSEGELKAREGTAHVDLKGCSSGGVTCTGLGEASGVILGLGTGLAVYDSLSPLGVAILGTGNPVHFSCSILLFEISGKGLCLVAPINTAAKHFEGKCELTGNDPRETRYWELNSSGVFEEHNLTAAEGCLLFENHGAGKDCAGSGSGLVLTTNNITIDG